MLKYFLNFMKIINPQIQEAQRNISIRNRKKTMPKHIIIKLLNTSDKEKS